jgi:O-antigen/teichoic acid export membrane protein
LISAVKETGFSPQTQASSKPRMSWFRAKLSPGKGMHQGFLSLSDQAVASITNFLTGVIIARASSKEEFGLYTLGFTVILLTTDLQTSLIATPYMVYAPRLKGAAHALYVGSTLAHQIVCSLLAMAVLACVAFAGRFGIGPHGLAPVLSALSAVIAFIMLRECVRRICFADLKLKAVFVFDLCVGLAQVGGLLVLAHFHLLSARTAYWLVGGACGIAVLSWLWIERHSYRFRLDGAVEDLKRNWSFGKWVFASGLLWTGCTNLYPWLLAFFHGTAAAGVFAACVAVVSASNPALLGIQNVLGPKIAHEYAAGGPKALRRLVLKLSATLAVPVSLLVLALMLWGGKLIALLYGSRYAGNGAVVAILAVNLLVTAMGFAFSRGLFAIERANVDFALNFAALAILLTVGLWLVKTHGPLGAALGLVAANIVTSVVKVGMFFKMLRLTPQPVEVS